MCVVHIPKPNFLQVIKDEKCFLDRYLFYEAHEISAPGPLKKLTRMLPPRRDPNPKALQQAREKYEADKARYLATGELPEDA